MNTDSHIEADPFRGSSTPDGVHDIGSVELEQELKALEFRRSRLFEDFADQVQLLRNKLASEVKAIDADIRARLSISGDLEVLVRHTPGPTVGKYHSALYPCGRLCNRPNFTQMTEARAKRRGHKRCTACYWQRHEAEAMRRRREERPAAE